MDWAEEQADTLGRQCYRTQGADALAANIQTIAAALRAERRRALELARDIADNERTASGTIIGRAIQAEIDALDQKVTK